MLVYRAIRYVYTYGMPVLSGLEMFQALQEPHLDAGKLPTRLYTGFYKLMIIGYTQKWLLENEYRILSDSYSPQIQNGLVEMLCHIIMDMDKAYLTEQQIPQNIGLCHLIYGMDAQCISCEVIKLFNCTILYCPWGERK